MNAEKLQLTWELSLEKRILSHSHCFVCEQDTHLQFLTNNKRRYINILKTTVGMQLRRF